LDNSEQDQPAESGPARSSSVWADMVMFGQDDQEEPEPGAEVAAKPWAESGGPEAAERGPGHVEPGHQGPPEGAPSWPASGLPPSFGQRSTEGEGPAVVPPAPGSGYGGYRPL